ncbi:MAG: hypothetical protein KJP02_07495 [Octadecabacter sp.]|nr:hypothetical protein [Octadecabacter sp.]
MTNDRDTDMLDTAFAAARSDAPAPSDDFLNRIMMDADAVLHDAVVTQTRPAVRPSWREMLFDAIGGWPSLGGLAAATVAGLWIGVSPPAALVDYTVLLSGETIEVPVWGTDILAGLEG